MPRDEKKNQVCISIKRMFPPFFYNLWKLQVVKNRGRVHAEIEGDPSPSTLSTTLTLLVYITLGFLAEISFTPLLYHPEGCLGCPEKGTRSRNYNLFVRSAVFQPKWNDVQKTYKNHQNPVKSYCFLGYFQSLFNFGWKTAAQTN